MCGVLAAMFEHYEEAKTFLERATGVDPPSVVAWTLLGEMKVCIPVHCYLTCEPAANTKTHSQWYDEGSCGATQGMTWSMRFLIDEFYDPFFLLFLY